MMNERTRQLVAVGLIHAGLRVAEAADSNLEPDLERALRDQQALLEDLTQEDTQLVAVALSGHATYLLRLLADAVNTDVDVLAERLTTAFVGRVDEEERGD